MSSHPRHRPRELGREVISQGSRTLDTGAFSSLAVQTANPRRQQLTRSLAVMLENTKLQRGRFLLQAQDLLEPGLLLAVDVHFQGADHLRENGSKGLKVIPLPAVWTT